MGIVAGAIQTSAVILLFFVGQEGVNDDLDPFSIFEELKRDEPFVEILLFDDKLLNEVRASADNRESRDELAGGK